MPRLTATHSPPWEVVVEEGHWNVEHLHFRIAVAEMATVGFFGWYSIYPIGSMYGISTWHLFVLYFGGWTLQNKAFSNQNRGHLGSRCIYTYIYHKFENQLDVGNYGMGNKTTTRGLHSPEVEQGSLLPENLGWWRGWNITSWWVNQPTLKIFAKLDHFPK